MGELLGIYCECEIIMFKFWYNLKQRLFNMIIIFFLELDIYLYLILFKIIDMVNMYIFLKKIFLKLIDDIWEVNFMN